MPAHTQATTRPRSQQPSPHGTWPPGPGATPTHLAHTGHRAAAGGRTPPRGDVLPPAPTLRQARPLDLLCDLAAHLRSHGLDHLYWTATPTRGVLSIAYGLTVWTNGHTLRCHTPTGTIHLPASTPAAADLLASLTHHTPTPNQEDRSPYGTPPPTPPCQPAAWHP